MLVLKVVLVLAVGALIVYLLHKINIFTAKKYKCEFFSIEYFSIFLCIFGLAFWGYDWYFDALKAKGDVLNGILIMAFTSIIYLLVLISNIRKSSFFFGLLITILQTIVFLPLSAAVLIIVIITLLFLSQTRPVYVLNK
ncbi:MAG: hypothetical protein CL624_14010 [Arcobacter sp.]|nr:hypothetical protein [Arcobacter sp.]